MKQYAAGLLPVRSILRRFPDLIQGTADATVDSGSSHPVMKADDPKFVQAVVQLVRASAQRDEPQRFHSAVVTACVAGVARAGYAATSGWSFGCRCRHGVAARARAGESHRAPKWCLPW